RVARPPADHLVRRRGEAQLQGLQPVTGGPAVVIGEGEDSARGVRGAGITGRRRSRVSLPEQRDVEPVPESRYHPVEGHRAAVVYHDDLEVFAAIVELSDRLKTGSELPRAAVGGNDDREERPVH